MGAKVVSITACPKIESGPGWVVLSTITHLNNYGFRLTLTNAAGTAETLGVTGFHKLYTEDRGWEPTAALHIGEMVRGNHGDLKVAKLVSDPGVHRVYNLTVEADHVYYVGNLQALAHNVCNPFANDEEALAAKKAAEEALHLFRNIPGFEHLANDAVTALNEIETQILKQFSGLLE